MSVTLLHGPGPVPTGPGVVVALTPSALQACAGAGVEAIVVDDVIDTRAISADRGEYVSWQLDWLARLDRALGAAGSLRAAALYLLTPVDSVVLSARRLRALLGALEPRAVTYVGTLRDGPHRPVHAGHVQFWPRLGDAPVVGLLLPLLARDLGVEANITPGRADPPLTAPATVGRGGALRRRAGSLVRQLQVLWPPVMGATDKTLLLWSSGYGAARFAAEERQAGHRTLVLERGRPVTSIRGPALRAAGPRVETGVRTSSAVLGPEVEALMREVDDWAGLAGAGALLATRVAAAGELAHAIGRAAGGLQPQLERIGIERVAAANPSTVEEFAALLAAGRAGARRLLLQHGDHLFPYDSWLVSETQNFDELWASDATVPDDLGRAAAAYAVATPEFRLRSPRVEALRKGAASPRRGERPTVVYVPSVLMGDSWLFGDGRFDDAWYHRWHLRLLELMAARTETDFVWKAYPAADQSFDPIPEEIERLGVANVRYETGRLVPELQRAHRVITDFPSTPLYEAVHLGRPVLALTFRRFAELRPRAAELFAPVLRECDTEEEGLAVVEGFLDDPVDPWVLPSSHVLPT